MGNRTRYGLMMLLAMLAVPATAGQVGFLDAERAVATVKEGQVAMKALEEWARPRRERLAAMEAEILELRDRLLQQRNVASQEVLKELDQQLLKARREFEDYGRDFNHDLEAKQDELLADVALKIGAVASDYGREHGFDAIFLYNAQPLVYVADGANLTDEIIRLYDQRFPVTD